MNYLTLVLIALTLIRPSLAFAKPDAPAALQGVKRIVFLGDSITAGGNYVTDVECGLLAQGHRLEVIGLGLSSETATDLTEAENAKHLTKHGFGRPRLSERLQRVLDATHPDLVFACYGMNDGDTLPAGPDGLARFSAAVTTLRDAILKAGAKRVVLCTPPVSDPKNRTAPDPREANLVVYSAWLMAQKKAAGWDVVDIHTPMLEALNAGRATNPEFRFAPDGTHPDRAGHWVMAQAILNQFLGVKTEGLASAEDLFPAQGKEIRALLSKRRDVRYGAYMTQIGHQRPGAPGGPGAKPGLSVEAATAQAQEIETQLASLLPAKK
jgi:lysophospholipase L1-like esterase